MAEIREAGPGDRPALVAFMAALQDFERGMESNRLPGAEMADRHLAWLEAWAAASGGGVLVAEGPSGLAGFVVFGIEEEAGHYLLHPRRGEVSDLWVAPDARRAGVAEALMRGAEARLAAAGVGRVEVTALARNAAARALYARLGYAEAEITFARLL